MYYVAFVILKWNWLRHPEYGIMITETLGHWHCMGYIDVYMVNKLYSISEMRGVGNFKI